MENEKLLAKNLFEVAFTSRVQEYEKMISGNIIDLTWNKRAIR